MVGDADESNLPGVQLDGEQDIEGREAHRLDGEEVDRQDGRAWARRNVRQVTEARRGAGRNRLPSSTARMLVADTDIPSFFSSPWTRR
jgi:hypothetical protein